MIHTHNTSDVLKAIYFIDADSEIDQPKGGNGKSVVMESLKYFKKTIKVDGKLFVHIFSHESLVYPFEDNGPSDWMGREFFSGGQMPSHRLLLHFQNDLKIEKVWRVSGIHYGKTSWAWLRKMDQNKTAILRIFSSTYGPENAKVWWQRWRIFFMSCAELFSMNHGKEWGVSHYLFVK